MNSVSSLVNSLEPVSASKGRKTASFEISDALGDSPDMVCIPVGNAGNITAYWRGFNEYRINERISKLPRMMGFQAANAAPIVRGEPIEDPQTIASAIRIGNPASWQYAVDATGRIGRRHRCSDRWRRSSMHISGWLATKGYSVNRRPQHPSRES